MSRVSQKTVFRTQAFKDLLILLGKLGIEAVTEDWGYGQIAWRCLVEIERARLAANDRKFYS